MYTLGLTGIYKNANQTTEPEDYISNGIVSYLQDAVQVSSSIVDYLISNITGYYKDAVQIQTSRVNYVIALETYSDADIIQAVNFAEDFWDRIDDIWNLTNEYDNWNI
tara:strand:+ start:356 stop:679 length:324 start_codon:yes stop_codon:yes gene_type:complete